LLYDLITITSWRKARYATLLLSSQKKLYPEMTMPNNNDKPDGTNHSHPSTGSGESAEILRIESIVSGGNGMARHPDGHVVFVPRTAPGERVEVEYIEDHRQWRRARVLKLHEASPDRCDPPCPYYASCGGCQLQHLDYAGSQIPAKAAIIADALRRIGKIEVDAPEITSSEHELGYRNRVSFVFRRRGKETVAGYHNVYDPLDLVDIDACLLAEQPINDVWAALRSAWNRAADYLPPGHELRLTFRVNSDSAVALAIEGGRGPGRPDKLLEIATGLVAVWVLDRRGDIVGHAGSPWLDERIGSYVVPLAGTGFLQVNREMAAHLDAYVRGQCGEVSGKRIVDAYCGFGLRALELARSGASAVGIERDRYAIKTAIQLAERTSTPVRFVLGEVERILKRFVPADTVILNPPRRGVDRPVIATLMQSDVTRVIYVSCDPATLARDLHRLAERFKLDALRGFDLFPQTAHVETVATLKRVD
jgi:23S rRNA (uracil1939-C5)-methyltransferase